MVTPDRVERDTMGMRTFWWFVALTFALTWGLGVSALVFTDALTALFGEFGPGNPLFILAVYSPALAALALVWRHHGLGGVGSFLRRLTLVRMSAGWWAMLVLGVPLAFYAGAAIVGELGGPFPFSPWHAVLPALAFTLVLGPVEELGWRGVALPLLQRRLAPLWSGLIVGVIWGVWHLPAFLIGGTPQSDFALGWFLLGALAISVIMTAMFNDSRGSILIMGLFHFQLNNPVWPDGQPWATYLLVAVAVLVVLFRRTSMLSRDGAVTEVLMPADGAVPSRPAPRPRRSLA
jgi:uncharacterized protein